MQRSTAKKKETTQQRSNNAKPSREAMLQNPANQRSNNEVTQVMKEWFELNPGGEGFKCWQQRLQAREIGLK